MKYYSIILRTGDTLTGRIESDQAEGFIHNLTTPYNAPVIFENADEVTVCVQPQDVVAFTLGNGGKLECHEKIPWARRSRSELYSGSKSIVITGWQDHY